MKISICIPSYNRPKELEECLNSLRKEKGIIYEVLISDDSSDALSPLIKEIAKKYGARYVKGPRKGLAANEENLVRHAKGDFIVFLGDDNIAGKGFVRNMVECFRRYSKIYGRKIVITGREIRNGKEITPGELTFLGYQAKKPKNFDDVKAIVICSTLFPSEFIKNAFFDRNLFYGFDEVDLVYQARGRGYRVIFCPEVFNIHNHSPIGREFYPYFLERGRIYEMLKIYGIYERNILFFFTYAILGALHLYLHAIKVKKPDFFPLPFHAFRMFYKFYRRWKWR